jgi:hypothetical protein
MRNVSYVLNPILMVEDNVLVSHISLYPTSSCYSVFRWVTSGVQLLPERTYIQSLFLVCSHYGKHWHTLSASDVFNIFVFSLFAYSVALKNIFFNRERHRFISLNIYIFIFDELVYYVIHNLYFTVKVRCLNQNEQTLFTFQQYLTVCVLWEAAEQRIWKSAKCMYTSDTISVLSLLALFYKEAYACGLIISMWLSPQAINRFFLKFGKSIMPLSHPGGRAV